MRKMLLIFILLLGSANAVDWHFQGFVRISVAQADTGISRIFNIPKERFFQTKLGFRTENKPNNTIEITFISADIRYLINNIPSQPDFNLSDNLVGRRMILLNTGESLQFHDDPDHILNEPLPFDINILCLMLESSLLTGESSMKEQKGSKPKTLIWSMPYVNQDKYRILERLMITFSHEWGDIQTFNIDINRDEVLKRQKTVITGTADGLGDGIISHGDDGTITSVNLTVHLDKSLLIQESDREGRLNMAEDHDFVLEAKR